MSLSSWSSLLKSSSRCIASCLSSSMSLLILWKWSSSLTGTRSWTNCYLPFPLVLCNEWTSSSRVRIPNSGVRPEWSSLWDEDNLTGDDLLAIDLVALDASFWGIIAFSGERSSASSSRIGVSWWTWTWCALWLALVDDRGGPSDDLSSSPIDTSLASKWKVVCAYELK